MSDWDGLDDNEGQGAAAPAGVDGGDGEYEPLDGYVDLNQRQAPFQASGRQWTPAPLDGSVDLTPAPMQGLLGNFKALPFDGTSERWLYHLPNTRGQAGSNDDGVRPWIISRPIDLAGGTSDGYFRTLGDTMNGPSVGTGAGMSMPDSGATQVDPITVMGHRNLIDRIGDAVGKIWGLPNTAMGLAAAGAGYVAGKVMGTDPQFHLGNNSIQLTGIPNIIGKDEVGTFGNVQLYEGKAKPTDDGRPYVPGLPNIKLGPHEEAHTRQSQALGLLYFPMWMALGGETPNNPMERAADYYAAGRGGSLSHFDQGPINLFGLKFR